MLNKKNGRKQKHHTDSLTGKPVDGLTRRPDGRWRIIGTHKTFREDDEQKAIAKYRSMVGSGLSAEATDLRLREYLEQCPDITRADLWRYFAEEVRLRPRWVAEQTGIEWIAYGPDLKPPAPLPTFAELETIFKTNYTKMGKLKILRAWEDFKLAAKVGGLKDITPETVRAYGLSVVNRKLKPKTQSNLYTRIRRFLTYMVKGKFVADKKPIEDALDSLSILTPSGSIRSFQPHPIEAADWQKLLATAEGEDKAMVLLMLNGAFSITEVRRLRWDEINNGCIVTQRLKEGECIRVCTLWAETMDALAKIKRKGTHVFISYQGLPLGLKGAEKRFRDLRNRAELPHVTSAQLRDGAATASASCPTVEQRFCDLLMGHRCGISDHYVLRNPKMVAPACQAVHNHYFPKEPEGGKPK